MRRNLSIPFVGVCFIFLFFSCVKDTDFEQVNDVIITPVVELDLIYFNLDASEFFDAQTNTERLVVRDTTEIRFLDDSGIQESLIQADFLFRFTNSIARDFEVNFDFLSEQNEITYSTGTAVVQGTLTNPIITEFEETVTGQDITQLTMADRVVVTVTIPSADASLEGLLNLKSKTTYFLEITERE